ncbi:MAG: trimethylamine methyltransferase family protein [Chloroflexi bacterium]|nr:trimethylamine methyltransferase family protein [Chloroflexota bacterium]
MRSNHSSFDTPHFRLLSDSQVEDLHLATLEVLKRTGVRVFEEEALDLLRRGGADISDGNLVRIPSHLVERAIRTAPKSITLYTRDGKPAISAQGTNVYYGPSVSSAYFLDPYSQERRQPTKEDVANVAKLCDALPNIDFVMGMVVVADCPLGLADREEFEAMVLNTNKPLVGWAYDAEGAKDIVEMGVAVRGSLEDLQRKPFFVMLADPTSPLSHSQAALQKFLYMADKNLPSLYLSNPMQAASSPATMAGSIVVSNAEMLSGLVLCQLKREGAPFFYSGLPLPLDLKTTVIAQASPEGRLTIGGCAEMAQYYHLPTFGVGGISDSKFFDEQAALEGAFTSIMAGLSGINLVHGLGFVESALTGSLEMLAVQDEMIGMFKRMMGGIEVNEETLALDVIDQVGPGGQYLDTDHTLKHYKENWYPRLMDRGNHSEWEEKGKKSLSRRANELVRQTLETYQPDELPSAVRQRIRGIMKRAEEKAGAQGAGQ